MAENNVTPTTTPPSRTRRPDRETVRSALEVACRAPSVHNTQPWRWVVAAHSVHLFADRSRLLKVVDPTGRDLVVSCGAALHHARVAFRALGWRADVHRLPNPAARDHLAALEFTPLPRIDQRMLTLVSASARRRTDRRPFLPDQVPPLLLDQLVAAGRAQQVRVTPVTDPVRRREVLVALAHADAVQRRDPMYQAELGEWTQRRLGATQGVPAGSVPVVGPASRQLPGRDFGPGELEGPPPLDDGAVLCVLSTAHDDPPAWLRTGEALSAVLLAATRAGLASCPLSQVSELPVTRDLVERAALDGVGRPHLAVRLGWPVSAEFPGPVTPRRRLDEVIGRWTD